MTEEIFSKGWAKDENVAKGYESVVRYWVRAPAWAWVRALVRAPALIWCAMQPIALDRCLLFTGIDIEKFVAEFLRHAEVGKELSVHLADSRQLHGRTRSNADMVAE